jgi:hypothetical protein
LRLAKGYAQIVDKKTLALGYSTPVALHAATGYAQVVPMSAAGPILMRSALSMSSSSTAIPFAQEISIGLIMLRVE